jgi:hypothetical protein
MVHGAPEAVLLLMADGASVGASRKQNLMDGLGSQVYSDEERTEEYLEALAVGRGCYIEEADDRTLQIDMLALLQSVPLGGDIQVDHRIACSPSRSGQGLHVRIRLKEPLPIIDRILLQACLGSDLRRELLSYMRVRNAALPVILFRPAEQVLQATSRLLADGGDLVAGTRVADDLWQTILSDEAKGEA